MMTWIFVLLAMLGASLVGIIISFFVLAIEKMIQYGGKGADEWMAMGIDCPGERLPAVSFLSGAIRTIISRILMFSAGTWVFLARQGHPSLIPMIAFTVLCVPNDLNRIRRFKGSTGQPTEIGYLFGGFIGFLLFLWLRHLMV